MIDEAINKLSSGYDLNPAQMKGAMEDIMGGNVETERIVTFLSSLNKERPDSDEFAAAVEVMRSHAIKVHTKHKVILDTCGTGGDRKHTFNISTAAAFIASGAGVIVAKHGNRSVSSKAGSADVLEALGININMPKDKIEKCLDDIGIAFLFAQNFHPAMKYAMEARKKIGERTIFNFLGPLTNPADATHQLVGVCDSEWAHILANALAKLNMQHALIVRGWDGLDEVTTQAKTLVYEVREGKLQPKYDICPEDFGFKRTKPGDLTGGTSSDNAKILVDILNGETGPQRDIVLLNAGAAIFAADKAKSIKEAINLAAESIDSGKALKKLELLKEYSNQ